MRTRTTGHRPAPAAVEVGYRAERVRVDAAYRRMSAIAAAPHAPVQARTAARELTLALRDATATATRGLQAAGGGVSQPGRRRRLRRRRTDRAVPAAVHSWSAELVRLAQIGVWLRRAMCDDLGVHVPAAVRVGDYAAKGPHVAGLGFGALAVVHARDPRIGVDLTATIDAANSVTTRPTGPVAPPEGADVRPDAKAA